MHKAIFLLFFFLFANKRHLRPHSADRPTTGSIDPQLTLNLILKENKRIFIFSFEGSVMLDPHWPTK